MQKHFILSLLAFLFVIVSARDPLADQLEYLKKIGDAKLKVLFWDIYNASLYSKTKEYKEEQLPQALQIIYLRNIDSEDLIEKTEEEWEKLGINQVKFNKWITLLKNIYPDIKKGDKLLFNQYGVMLINKVKCPMVKSQLGQKFINWLLSNKGQKHINYKNLKKIDDLLK